MFLFRRLTDRALEWLSVEMERRQKVRLAKYNELMRPVYEARRAAIYGRRLRPADELVAGEAPAAPPLS